MRAGCSIRLSTPPSDSASWKSFVRATSSTASASVSIEERDHPAEVAHLPRATSWPGCARQAGVEHALDRRVAVEELGDAPRVLAVLAHAHGERLDPAQHEPRVERAGHGAERLLQEAAAARRARRRSSRRSRRSRRCGRRGTSSSSGRRASAPSSSGCCRYGVAKVLSTASSAPTACAASAALRMSTTFSSGFDGVSTHTSLTSSPRWAARFSSNSVGRHVGEAVALRLVDLRGHAVDAAVDVGDQHDALARVDEVHQRRRRAEPGAERDAVLGALEARERDLERRARRVARRASSRSPC